MNKKNSAVISKINWKSQTFSIFIAMILLICVFSALNPLFLRIPNLISIITNAAILGILATGCTMTMLTGGIDLSITGIAACAGMMVGLFFSMGWPIIVCAFFALCLGAVLGLMNGLLIAKVKITPLVTTLATSLVFTSLAYAITDMKIIYITEQSFVKFGRGNLIGIPYAVFYMLVFYIVVGFVLKYTSFGRKIYAIGGNSTASYLCGIKIEKNQIALYVISGTIAAFAGVLATAQAGAAIPQTLNGEFSMLSAR